MTTTTPAPSTTAPAPPGTWGESAMAVALALRVPSDASRAAEARRLGPDLLDALLAEIGATAPDETEDP